MRLFILLFGLSFISSTFRPGSGTAYLKCKSESGKTIFNAELQDIVGLLESAEFTVDTKKVKFDGSDEAFTIFDPKNGVFTIYINGKTNEEFTNSRFVSFWAIPTSFKIINKDRANQKYEFKAKIFGTEPRKGRQLITPEIKLICTLEYKI